MKIKKYELTDAASEQSLKSNAESIAMMSQSPDDGKEKEKEEEEEVSFGDFIRMLDEGTWKGGYVKGLGYVAADEFEKTTEPGEYSDDYYKNGQITRFVHSSHSFRDYDFDSYLSKMYSMMYVATIPESESGTKPSSDENSNNQNGNGNSGNSIRYYKGENYIVDGVTIYFDVMKAGAYTLVTIYVSKEHGYSNISIVCSTGLNHDMVSETIFDSSNEVEVMNKKVVATKAYYDPANRPLMTVEIFRGGTRMFVIDL